MKLFFVFNEFINFKRPIEFEVRFWWTNLTSPFVSLCVAVTNLIPPVVRGWKRFRINYDVAVQGEQEGLLGAQISRQISSILGRSKPTRIANLSFSVRNPDFFDFEWLFYKSKKKR